MCKFIFKCLAISNKLPKTPMGIPCLTVYNWIFRNAMPCTILFLSWKFSVSLTFCIHIYLSITPVKSINANKWLSIKSLTAVQFIRHISTVIIAITNPSFWNTVTVILTFEFVVIASYKTHRKHLLPRVQCCFSTNWCQPINGRLNLVLRCRSEGIPKVRRPSKNICGTPCFKWHKLANMWLTDAKIYRPKHKTVLHVTIYCVSKA